MSFTFAELFISQSNYLKIEKIL